MEKNVVKNAGRKMIIINMYLLWGAWQDARERKVNVVYLRIGEIGGICYRIITFYFKSNILEDWMYAMLPGIFFLITAKLTKEKLGLGDAIVLLILGNVLHFHEIRFLLLTAMMLTILFSVLLLIGRKADGKYEIPFLPFLWMSHTLMWGLYYA